MANDIEQQIKTRIELNYSLYFLVELRNKQIHKYNAIKKDDMGSKELRKSFIYDI